MSDKFETDFSSTNTTPNGETGAEPETTESLQSTAGDEPGLADADTPPAKKRRRLGRKGLIAIGVAALLLVGSGAWGYSVYQSPTTVIGMAIGSLADQKSVEVDLSGSGASLGGVNGEIKFNFSKFDLGADVNAQLNLNLAGQPATANLEAISSKTGDIYLQLSKFESLASLLATTGMPQSSISALSSTLDGKWVKISKAEIDQLAGPSGSAATCIQAKFNDKAHAAEVSSEIMDLVKAHPFMAVSKELGTKDGNVGYQLGLDVPELKAMFKGVLDTKAFADVTDCGVYGTASGFSKQDAIKAIDSIKQSDVDSAMKNLTIEIWADQWSHKLANLSITSQDSNLNFEFSVKPASAPTDSLKIPTETISVAELQTAVLTAAYGN